MGRTVGRTTLASGVDWRTAVPRTRGATSRTGLYRARRETSSRHNTLSRAVEANAKRPSIVVLMKNPYKVPGMEF